MESLINLGRVKLNISDGLIDAFQESLVIEEGEGPESQTCSQITSDSTVSDSSNTSCGSWWINLLHGHSKNSFIKFIEYVDFNIENEIVIVPLESRQQLSNDDLDEIIKNARAARQSWH